MDSIVADLAEQHVELGGLLSSLEDADWDRPSRCEGWTVADVVLHLAQTDDMAIASLEGRFGELVEEARAGLAARDTPSATGAIDQGADLLVAWERGAPGPAVRDRWQIGADALDRLLRSSDPRRRVPWVAGELSVRTLATARLAEAWIHTGDIAVAFDVSFPPTDRLRHVARLAWRTLPYAFAQAGLELAGPVAFDLRGPGGDRWRFVPDGGEPATTIRGDAVELCLVAARRLDAAATGLSGEGPDAEGVLRLVRTYA